MVTKMLDEKGLRALDGLMNQFNAIKKARKFADKGDYERAVLTAKSENLHEYSQELGEEGVDYHVDRGNLDGVKTIAKHAFKDPDSIISEAVNRVGKKLRKSKKEYAPGSGTDMLNNSPLDINFVYGMDNDDIDIATRDVGRDYDFSEISEYLGNDERKDRPNLPDFEAEDIQNYLDNLLDDFDDDQGPEYL